MWNFFKNFLKRIGIKGDRENSKIYKFIKKEKSKYIKVYNFLYSLNRLNKMFINRCFIDLK